MTRQKKTRKVAEFRTKSKDTRTEKPTQNRRKKAPKGQKSGSRNSLIEAVETQVSGTGVKKDPKLGSKKPISLTGKTKSEETKPEITHSAHKPAAKLNKAKLDIIPPDVELTDIESDEKLIALVERVEDGELLTGKDAKYFNKQMDRHAELLKILGVEDSDEEDEEFNELEGLKSDQWDDLLDDE